MSNDNYGGFIPGRILKLYEKVICISIIILAIISTLWCMSLMHWNNVDERNLFFAGFGIGWFIIISGMYIAIRSTQKGHAANDGSF